jgi:hypothetical protein
VRGQAESHTSATRKLPSFHVRTGQMRGDTAAGPSSLQHGEGQRMNPVHIRLL